MNADALALAIELTLILLVLTGIGAIFETPRASTSRRANEGSHVDADRSGPPVVKVFSGPDVDAVSRFYEGPQTHGVQAHLMDVLSIAGPEFSHAVDLDGSPTPALCQSTAAPTSEGVK